MTKLERAVLAHLMDSAWADPPETPGRRRRLCVAFMLGLKPGEALAAARRVARAQKKRGVRTIDTATLPPMIDTAVPR